MAYGKGSNAEIKQRQNAAKTHGVHSFKSRGESALRKPARLRLEELRAQV